MELMENIIFLFIQHVRIRLLVYSQKERKKISKTLGQTVLLSFPSQLSMNQCRHAAICVCPYSFLPKSLWTPNIHRFFQMLSGVFVLWWVQQTTFFLFILHLCQFSFSWVIGGKTHNSPIYTASLLIHIRGLYNGR